MNTTAKLVFALVIAAGLTATGAAIRTTRHSSAMQSTPTIQLAAVVVTPADAEPETIQLDAVLVTPANADTRFADLRTQSAATPVNAEPEAIQLDAVVVTPANADARFADVLGQSHAEHSAEPAITADMQATAAESLLQAIVTLSPGQFVNTGAALRAFSALAFPEAGN